MRDEDLVKKGENKVYRGLALQQEQLAEAFRALGAKLGEWFRQVEPQLSEKARATLAENAAWQGSLKALAAVEAGQLTDKAAINEPFKTVDDAVTFADKHLRPDKDKTFTKADLRGALKRLAEARDDALFVLERIAYFDAQLDWLDTNFPGGEWRNVEGLCKIASQKEIAEQQFSLNPGRYVGVALEDDGLTAEDFRDFMQSNAAALAQLHKEADELQRLIAGDVEALFVEAKAEAA